MGNPAKSPSAKEERKGFRVGLMGASWYTGNRGVSALATSVVSLVWRRRPDASICLLIGQREAKRTSIVTDRGFRTVETVNFRLQPRGPVGQQLWWILIVAFLCRVTGQRRLRGWAARRSSWIQAVMQADLVGDIRGGDSFSDTYGARRFLVGSLPVVSVMWLRGGLHLLPQTYGPFRSRASRWMARYILLHAETIWCRDRASAKEVAALTGGRRHATLCPDVAFALEGRIPECTQVEPPIPPEEQWALVGINVSGLLYNSPDTSRRTFGLTLDYRTFVRRLVEQLLSNPGLRVLLIPHEFATEGSIGSDPDACRLLRESLSASVVSRVHIVTKEYDQHEIKGIIGTCDFFIGSRMHACIAALSQGIPTIGVAYSRKFVGVFETVGAGHWVIDGRTEAAEAALERVRDLFERRNELRRTLEVSVPYAQQQLRQHVATIMSSATGRSVGTTGGWQVHDGAARARPGEPVVPTQADPERREES